MSLLDQLRHHIIPTAKLSMDEAMPSRLDQAEPPQVGRPHSRIEGPLKVCGQAAYTAEHHPAGLCHGVMVTAPIGKGQLKKIHDQTALDLPGVVAVIHDPKRFLRNAQQGGMKMAPAQGATEIAYHGQPVALVVAETFEAAREGAMALRIDYADDTSKGQFDFAQARHDAEWINWVTDKNENRGHPERMLKQAEQQVDVTYITPSQSNMAMELHASLAQWQDDQLTVYTANQMLGSSREQLADALGVSVDQIRLLAPYVGGGFGSKLGIAPEIVMAALAARDLKRPVLVSMTRAQVTQSTVRRSNTEQRLGLAADGQGQLQALIHNSLCTNLPKELFFEPVAVASHFLYQTDHAQIQYRMVRMNLGLAGSMRAPGEAVGMLGLECAMDELAHQLEMCPLELRLRNEPTQDPSKKIPYSTRQLTACLRSGAERFGWSARTLQPAQRREGDWWIGMGVASAARSNELKPAEAEVRLQLADTALGVRALVRTDMTDIGTGSYTILAQIAADLLGLPVDHVEVQLGDTHWPQSSGSGGSWGAASTGSAVYLACEKLREQIAKAVGLHTDTLHLTHGQVQQRGVHQPSLTEQLGERLTQQVQGVVHQLAQSTGLEQLSQKTEPNPPADSPDYVPQSLHDVISATQEPWLAHGQIKPGQTQKDYRHAAFGAHFAEVAVHAVSGQVRVLRMLGVYAAGRILNAKTARSQCIGGMIFGMGGALMEKMTHDPRDGRVCTLDLAEYHVPAHADMPEFEVMFLPEADVYANPLHSKGLGELGISGSGAAIANAVFNAIGARVRDYPLTPEKILPHLPILPEQMA